MTQNQKRLTRPNGSYDLETAIDSAEQMRRNHMRLSMPKWFAKVAQMVSRASEGFSVETTRAEGRSAK